jgi:hypothetical protein
MKPDLANLLLAAGIFGGAVIIIFFVTRIFWLWYWKIDKIEAHLAAISSTLKSMEEKAVPDVVVKKVTDEKYWPK